MTTPSTPSDPAPRVAWLRSGPFSYTDEGRGPAVLALHGQPGSARDFRWLGAALEGRVRMLRLEQPGFGATPRATEPDPSLAGRTRFVADAAEALGLERFTVLGHSIGGPLAMSVAATLPGQVERLVLLASVGLRPHRMARRAPRFPDAAALLASPIVAHLVLPALRKGFVAAGFPRATPDEEMIQSSRVFSRLSFSAIRRAANGVRCPTLLAWTEDDPLVEPAIGLELSAALPGHGPRLAFPTGGHNPQKTQAVEIADALLAWLDGG